VFDKDGTLIDFNWMWATWITDLARRLEARIELDVLSAGSVPAEDSRSFSDRLFHSMGFDPAGGRVLAGSRLALSPMAELRELTVAIVRQAGIAAQDAELIVADAWTPPDPVALARPLADLPALFGALRARGLRIAVAPADDHAPAVGTLAGLGVAGLVDAVVGADDGLPIKPAPDMILKLCHDLSIAPARAIMIGDAAPDLEMGRVAGVGLVVGVLSGISPAALLAPHADVLLSSIADLVV
jgi:phosphoglycolate phosphatase